MIKKYNNKKIWRATPVKTILKTQIELYNRLVLNGTIPQSPVVETNTTKSSIYNAIGQSLHGGKSKRCKYIKVA